MSEIKAMKSLRGLGKEVADMRWGVKFDRAIDAIEAEVAERYMELPVDADGVPIHIGDILLKSTGAPKASYGDVVGVSDDSVWFDAKNGWESNWANLTRHVKPRTIEDVLRDCCNEWNEHCGDDWESGVYAKYAAELRELMGGAE